MGAEFRGTVVEWRGPSPYHFVVVPARQSRDLQDMSRFVTYGWGMIPVTARIGATEWTTSLFPREGRYWLPLKDTVRTVEGITVGQRVRIRLAVRGAAW